MAQVAKRPTRSSAKTPGPAQPVPEDVAKLEETPEPPQAEEIPDGPETVLLVENEHPLAVSLLPFLQNLGYKIIGPVTNRTQAIELARKTPPSLALLNTPMPEAEGLDLVRVLFTELGIPMVISSAFTAKSSLKPTAKGGIFGYIVEPATAADMQIHLAIAWACYWEMAMLRNEVRDLKTKLENRIIIEKAKGLLMTKLGLAEDAAMTRLRKEARDTRRKLIEMARAIVETDELLHPR